MEWNPEPVCFGIAGLPVAFVCIGQRSDVLYCGRRCVWLGILSRRSFRGMTAFYFARMDSRFRRNDIFREARIMGKPVTKKIIAAHRMTGRCVPGAEIGIRIDQTLTQDATGERLQKRRYA